MNYTMEGVEEAVSGLEDFVDDLQKTVEGVFESANDLIQATNHDLLLQVFKKMEKSYNETVIQEIKGEINKWNDEGNNFVWSVKSIHAGEEAYNLADSLQQRIVDKIQDIVEIDLFDNMTVDASKLAIESQKINEGLEQIIEQITPLESRVEECEQDIRTRGEDNYALSMFLPVVVKFGNSTKEFMKQLTGEVKNRFSEFLEEKEASMNAAVEENRQADEKYIQSVLDNAKERFSEFDGLFDDFD